MTDNQAGSQEAPIFDMAEDHQGHGLTSKKFVAEYQLWILFQQVILSNIIIGDKKNPTPAFKHKFCGT